MRPPARRLSWGQDNPEPNVVVPVVRVVVVAVRRPAVPRRVVPATAAIHAVRASFGQDPSMLSMRPAYENDNWKQDISELSQRISQYKPWFLKHFYLDAIAILFIVLSVGLVTILILL